MAYISEYVWLWQYSEYAWISQNIPESGQIYLRMSDIVNIAEYTWNIILPKSAGAMNMVESPKFYA